MFDELKFNKESPIYIQIKNYMKSLILKGLLQPNQKLPSTRELSSILKVSRNTVITAFEYLEDEGFIHAANKMGYYVDNVNTIKKINYIDFKNTLSIEARLADNLDITKHEEKWEKGMISFTSIAPDGSLFNVDDFKRAFQNVISMEEDKILNYGYAEGYKPLIDFLKEYMEGKGANLKGKRILVTNGFTEGFNLILRALTNKGDTILCENPTHNTVIEAMKLHGLNIGGINMDRDGLNLKNLKEAVSKNKNIKGCFLIPSYHNPTGIVTSFEKRLAIYEILMENNIPIIEDGFNEELRYSGSHVAPMMALCGEGNSVVYIGSFSKILFPGLRIGYIMGDELLISHLESLKRSLNIHTSFLDQAILYEYFKDGGFEKYLKKAKKIYRDKYEYAIKLSDKYFGNEEVYGNGGLHIFVKLKNINARELLSRCLKRNVIFIPGDVFYTDKRGENTLRLGFGRLPYNDIENGFKIIGEEIKKIRSEG